MHVEVDSPEIKGVPSEAGPAAGHEALRTARHDFKNQLQLLASVLNLQRRRTADPEALDVIDSAHARLMCVANLHQLIDLAPSADEIDLAELIGSLLRYHRRSQTRIRSSIEGGGVIVPAKRALPLALIVNELVMGALRAGAAADEDVSFDVSIFRNGNGGSLMKLTERRPSVADPSIQAKELFAEQLINTLRAQVRGELSSTADGAGTREFIISF